MYRIIYSDDKIFLGGKPLESNWNLIENKPIKKLEYKLGKETIVLQNFEAYNHVWEMGAFIVRGRSRLLKVMIMGKFKNKVYVFTYDYKQLGAYTKIYKFGHEHNNKPTTGWKQGLPGLKPKINVK